MLHTSLLQLDHFKSSSYTPERANEKIEPNWQKITRNIKQNFMAYYLHVEPKRVSVCESVHVCVCACVCVMERDYLAQSLPTFNQSHAVL